MRARSGIEPASRLRPRKRPPERRPETIRDAAITRIRASAQDGLLWTLDRLPYVLFRWLEWSTEEEVRAAVTAQVATDENLVAFVGRFASESHSHTMGDKVSRVHRKISRKGLTHLLDLEAATRRLKAQSSPSRLYSPGHRSR